MHADFNWICKDYWGDFVALREEMIVLDTPFSYGWDLAYVGSFPVAKF